jgi:hypothetical protein
VRQYCIQSLDLQEFNKANSRTSLRLLALIPYMID